MDHGLGRAVGARPRPVPELLAALPLLSGLALSACAGRQDVGAATPTDEAASGGGVALTAPDRLEGGGAPAGQGASAGDARPGAGLDEQARTGPAEDGAGAAPQSPLDGVTALHTIFIVQGERSCVRLGRRDPERLTLDGESGRSGWIRIAATADGFRIVGAGGSGTSEGMGFGRAVPAETYRWTNVGPARLATDRGVLYLDEATCEAERLTDAVLDLGGFAELASWLFPEPQGPRTDRLARAMRGGSTIFRVDGETEACVAWRFVAAGPGGLRGRLVRRTRRGESTIVEEQSYEYDPSTQSITLTDVATEVRRGGRAVEGSGLSDAWVGTVMNQGEPVIDVNGELWYLARADCQHALAVEAAR